MVMDQDSFFNITDVSRETMKDILCYLSLLKKWQKNINLISNDSMADIWSRHFYDSFQLKPLFVLSARKNLQILDIGSGAGFPGLLLSMLGLGKFHLVESNGKKCAFINQVIRETQSNAVVHCDRVEKLAPFHVDYIISRACAPLDKLMELGQNFIHQDTICLFLKGKNIDQEIVAAQLGWKFALEKFSSISEPSGVIVKISNIRRHRSREEVKG